MQHSIIIGLIQNTAILLTLSMLYDYSWAKNEHRHSLRSKIVTGLIIGIITVFLMWTPWVLAPGIVFDTRSILLSISGLFFGPFPTFIAMAIATGYRIFLGGDGLLMGISVILSSGIIGLLWQHFRPQWRHNKFPALELFALGIMVHAAMLAGTALLPSEKFLETFKTIALPLFAIYAPGTVLLGLLMIRHAQNWENRNAKDRLLESQRWFTELLKNMNLMSVIIDKKGIITFANNYFHNNTGYSYYELIGSNWVELLIPERERGAMRVAFKTILNDKQEFLHHENEIVIKNGSKLLVSWNNTLLRDQNGQTIGIASIGEIIHKQKLLERKKLQFAHILESSLNEIYVFNAKSLYFSYVNYGALKNLGYSLEQIKCFTPLDIMKDYDEDAFQRLIEPLVLGKENILVFEAIFTRINGTYYPVEIHLQLFDETPNQLFLAVVQDISERKKYEIDLIQAKLKAEESDKLKSIFLANLSHEIRTPMNSIAGFTNLLLLPDVTPDKKIHYTEIIEQSLNKLLIIINNLLDMSKIEANQLSIHNQEFDLIVLLKNTKNQFMVHELMAMKPQLTLELENTLDIPEFKINSDEARIKQILDNLISNALKYTQEGSVRFGFSVLEKAMKLYLQFHVHDTGIGIPNDKKELVFKRFRQIEEDQFHEGTGLGLSISKGIVELMEGDIWFESTEGKGSSFYFTVPLESNQTVKERKPIVAKINPTKKTSKKVLVVEDDYNSYFYLNEILESEGFEVIHATNGTDAVNYTSKHQPDVVLLDMNIPEKSGLECLKEIRQQNKKVKIIIQTAYAYDNEVNSCFALGCNGYLQKPLNKQHLLQTLTKVLSEN